MGRISRRCVERATPRGGTAVLASGLLCVLAILLLASCPAISFLDDIQERVIAFTSPGNPAILSAAGGDHQVTVVWSSVQEATSYNLYWAQDSTVSTTSGTKVNTAQTSQTVDFLSCGEQYAFVVTAVGVGGESAPSNVVTATTNYSVTYHANGAENGAPPSDTITYPQDQPVTVLGNLPPPDSLTWYGYSFIGWSTTPPAPDDTIPDYQPDDTFPMGADNVELYAHWVTAGSTWTPRTMPSRENWSSVVYGDGKFVAIASGSSNVASTSPDGITWTPRSLPDQQSWNSIAYGNGIFVAVVWAGGLWPPPTNVAASSLDGITWTPRTMPTDKSWVSVAWGENMFVAVPGSAGEGFYTTRSDRGARSTNGETWVSITLPSTQNWYSVCYGNDRFVAVAYSSSNAVKTKAAAYSDDGIIWTAIDLPIEQNWVSVAYGGGRFVAVAGGPGTATDKAAWSSDGITWTESTMVTSRKWQAVTFGNGRFVAVPWENCNAVAICTDGTDWTESTLPSSQVWEAVTYGNGRFVTLAYDSNVAATSP